ncbi:MAG: monovalent cation/H(+) antiporter subunit G [Candidatus Cloacimonetes bacterium]|nr:monovalent cation/H(+) antiporter subunit G [Candidatus Cloacimonadota bacterium]
MLFIASIISLLGALFLFLGSMGVLRMPDVYNRMQAGTKATTLGTMMTLLGIGLANTAWLPKILLLILFVLFTNPISSSALARAAHFSGIKLTDRSIRDNLADDKVEEQDA